MAISKIIYKTDSSDTGTVWMDTTDKTVAADKMVSGITALKNDGTTVTGNLTSRSSSDLTASGATVTVPAGVYSSQASKAVASGSASTPATTITANPSISVSSGGLITATASATQSVTPTVSAGYVSSGTAGTITVSGSNTSQLTTQGAQTIHPSTTAQSIASGKYLTGAQTIAAVVLENLTAGNIKKDVVVKIGDADDDDCVASVTGTYEGGGGGSTTWETVYNGTQSITSDWGNGKYYVMINSWSETIDLNSVWRITWDGTPYECTATWAGSLDGDPYAIGNYTYDGGSGGTDNPFFMQVYWSSELAIVTAVSGSHTIKIEKQVSGGGSSYTLLASEEFTVNTTSTSNVNIGTISAGASAFTSDKILYVRIRDKAGQRRDYFYGSDTFFENVNPATESTSTFSTKALLSYYANASGWMGTNSSGYGVYAYSVDRYGDIVIYARYGSTTSRTINGTFKCDVYLLDWPDGVSPFVGQLEA